MNGFFLVSFVIYAISYALAIDEECQRYHYEQQILSKQIRMDLRLDILEEKIGKLEQQEGDCAISISLHFLRVVFDKKHFISIIRQYLFLVVNFTLFFDDFKGR